MKLHNNDELDGRDWDYNNVDVDQIMLDNASSIINTTTNPCLIMPCYWISKCKQNDYPFTV